MTRTAHIVLLGSILAVGSSCGGPQPGPAAPAEPAVQPAPVTVELSPPRESQPAAEAAPSAPSPEATAPWKEMSAEQRMAHMKQVVLPEMASLFKAHDAKEFAAVDCRTCHGKQAELGHFAMPSADLPKLDSTNGFAAEKKKDAPMVEFMMNQVTPRMARLLDAPPYDPTTQQGFGCSGCHTMKK